MFGHLKSAIRGAVWRTPFGRYFGHRHLYNFTPRQLCFLVDCIDRTASLSGAILEVGTYRGHTAVFLNAHMTAEGIEKPYIAVDTFGGFVPAHVAQEAAERGKERFASVMRSAFSDNSKALFDRQMAWNGITRVRSIEADAAEFDYATVAPLSFALIDVDLYIPVLRALERVVPLVQPGGIVVVDDCDPTRLYDGALQAYSEFTAAHGLPANIVHRKLGVIQL